MNLAWLLVLVVYGIVVARCSFSVVRAALRRDHRAAEHGQRTTDNEQRPLVPWRIAALFYLLVLAFLWRPLVANVVNYPVDVIRLLPPWSAYGALDKFGVSNFEIHDLPMQTVPWAHQVRESWRALDVPLWNERAGLGYPLLANAQSAALSPFRLLALPLPLGPSIAAEAAMKLLVALTGMYLFCRRRGYGELPSVAGAVAFGFCSFVVVWLHFAIASTVCWLPVVLLAVDSVAGGGSRRKAIALSAILGALIAFGGHPESLTLIALGAGAYALWLIITVPDLQRGRFVASILLAMIGAALLAAPLLLPFYEAATRSHRFAELQGHAYLGMPYSDLRSLAPMLHPRYFGRGLGMPAETLGGFAGVLAIAAWAGVLVDVIRRRAWRSVELFFVVAMAVTFAFLNGSAPGEPPYAGIVGAIMNPRLRLLFCFFGAMQIAALLHYRSRLGSGVGVLFAAAVGAFVVLQVPPMDVRVLVPSGVVLLVALIGGQTRVSVPHQKQTVFPVFLIAAMLFELWFAMRDWNPVVPASEAYPGTLMTGALQKLVDEAPGPYRVVGLGPVLFPNAHVLFGVDDLRQHDPMASAAAIAWLRAHSSYETKEYFAKWNEPDSPALDRLNVRWILTEPARDLPKHRLLYDGPDGRIYENATAKPRFFSDDANVRIIAKRGTRYRLRIDASKPARIVSSIPFYPGWRAKGFDVVKVDGAFVGFDVPAGSREVVVDYAPWSFRVGVLIGFLTAVAVAAQLRARQETV
ncbi:MAG TPA: hypothetical protein VGF69_20500 [Thermoanaerobaculia bacterium]|jgi:hypothetical protein